MSHDNQNGQTIAGFSTMAGSNMLMCQTCPYKDYLQFYEYYGADDYAHQWVQSALKGEATNFLRGNADFGAISLANRTEAFKKGTVILNVFMYVIQQLERALDDCMGNSLDDSIHSWDSVVALYTGSLVGEREGTKEGNMLFRLANLRCKNTRTCGIEGNEAEGNAKVNYDIFN
eukprot:14835647-Ditylum_brightwellii.AAC.1